MSDAAIHRRQLRLGDPTADLAFQRSAASCASLDEHAAAAGIPTAALLTLLEPHLEMGTVKVEIAAGAMFLHTAPQGRPGPSHLPEATPNLWERLRNHDNVEASHALWRLVRALEAGGWNVEANQLSIIGLYDPVTEPPRIGVVVNGSPVPLVTFPTAAAVPRILEMYATAGYPSVAITCLNGALDPTITAVREWEFARGHIVNLAVYILEAPRFAPTLVTAHDNAVTPISVARYGETT